jgi:hypothetical protein
LEVVVALEAMHEALPFRQNSSPFGRVFSRVVRPRWRWCCSLDEALLEDDRVGSPQASSAFPLGLQLTRFRKNLALYGRKPGRGLVPQVVSRSLAW